MIIFILRHADRLQEDDLSAKGRDRARLLARMLRGSGVSIAYRSDTARARQTLEPLKEMLDGKLQVETIGITAPATPDGHVKQIIDAIKALPPDKVAVVVSHSDTVGTIAEGLGGRSGAPIGDNEFDRLFILARPKTGPTDCVQVRFGEPTP